MKNRHFSEYRSQDYRTVRSIREQCGWDAPLYVEEPESPVWPLVFCGLVIAGLLGIALIPLMRA